MKAFIVLFVLLTFTPVFSQQWTWDTLAQNHQGDRLCKDVTNHIYSYAVGDTVLTRMSDKGAIIWQKSFPSNFRIQSLCCSPDTNVYLLAYFDGTVSAGTNTFNSMGQTDLCLCKLSPSGGFIWSQHIGSKGEEFGGGICMHGNNVLITGSAADTTNFAGYLKNKQSLSEFFIGRFFPSGVLDTVLFSDHTILDPDDFSRGLEVTTDQAGNIYTVIRIAGYAHIDTTALLEYNTALIYKFNQTLNHQWHYKDTGHAQFSAKYFDPRELTATPQNELIYTIPYVGVNTGYSRIVKLDATGGTATVLYQTTPSLQLFCLGFINGIDLDTCGNVNFTGESFYFDTLQLNNKSYLWVGQLSPAGNMNWIKADSSTHGRAGRDIVSLGLNKAFVSIYHWDSLLLKQNVYLGQGQVNAIIQATFGVPWNTTPVVNQNICANNKTALQCATAGFIQWYTSSSGLTSVGSGSSFVTPPLSAGVYTWYAEATTCTMVSGRLPITVTVNPQPLITVSDGSICPGQQFVISPSPALNYNFSSGNPSVSPTAHTTYTVIGHDSNGCYDTALVNVHVRSLPSISVQQHKEPVCMGEALTLSLTGGQSYSVGNTPVSNPFTFITNSLTVMLLKTEDTFGCQGTMIYHQKVSACTELNEVRTHDISIFPNPSNGRISLQGVDHCRIEVINSVGLSVYSQESDAPELNLNLSTLTDGVYFLKVEGKHIHVTRKIILRK